MCHKLLIRKISRNLKEVLTSERSIFCIWHDAWHVDIRLLLWGLSVVLCLDLFFVLIFSVLLNVVILTMAPRPATRRKQPQQLSSKSSKSKSTKKALISPVLRQKRWPDWGLNPGPTGYLPDALPTELSGLTGFNTTMWFICNQELNAALDLSTVSTEQQERSYCITKLIVKGETHIT